MRDRQTDIYAVVVNFHIIGIWCHTLLVPVGTDDWLEFTSLAHTDAKSRTFTMIGNHYG